MGGQRRVKLLNEKTRIYRTKRRRIWNLQNTGKDNWSNISKLVVKITDQAGEWWEFKRISFHLQENFNSHAISLKFMVFGNSFILKFFGWYNLISCPFWELNCNKSLYNFGMMWKYFSLWWSLWIFHAQFLLTWQI